MMAPGRQPRLPRIARPLFYMFLCALAASGATCGYNPHFQSGITRWASSGQACPGGFSCDVGRGVCVAADGGAADLPSDHAPDVAGGDDSGDNGTATGSGGDSGTGGTGLGGTGGAATGGTSGSGGATGSGGAITDAGDAGEAGCSADIATSPTNCGACGHSCGGGTCDRGACQPSVIPGVLASSIAVDASRLYFTNSTKVLACPKTGCVLQPTQLDDMGSGGYSTWSVVVTNGSLFFMSAPTQAGTEHDDLFMCPLAGCPSPAPILAMARFGVSYLTNAGNDVYWSDTDGTKLTYRRVCQPNAGACDTPVTIVPEGVNLGLLGARSDEFYFVDALGLQKCPYAGCPGTTAAATGATVLTSLVPTAVVVFGNLIYMQFGDDMHTLNGAIRTCTPGDCDAHVPRNFIANREAIRGLTVDANGVYWMEQTTLYSCPLTGCLGGAKTLATGVTRTFNSALSTRPIVTDDAFVYWINDDAGVVKRIAK
ncbi:MAG TPA: hypothetical protein VNO55_15930 [Polyangia bacterium]|nr:hypothetical protein [Polyangia bacterium]